MADPLAGSSLNPEEPTSSLPLPGDKRHWSFATEWYVFGGGLSSLRPPSDRWTDPSLLACCSATVENPSVALKDQHGSSSVPIYQTATFKGMDGAFDYTRSGNPTRSFLGALVPSLPPRPSYAQRKKLTTAVFSLLRAPPQEALGRSVGPRPQFGHDGARLHPPARQAWRDRPGRRRHLRRQQSTARMGRNRRRSGTFLFFFSFRHTKQRT